MSESSLPQIPGYDVVDRLGEGASSTVWRGRRRADGMAVALKVLRPARGDIDAALREAGLLAAVRHQHVVHLYDVLPLPMDGSDRPGAVVLVTQLAAGGSLAQLLSRRRMLSPGELVTVLQPVAGALADLHVHGVVHGDLSTGNVLFREDGMPLLADLGTARVAGERGVVWGTGAEEGMVAPEVLEGFPATAESDVYQLGALAWLALTGEPPGPGHLRVPLEEKAADLEPRLVELVTRCTAPQPEDRPDAEEFARALMGIAVPEPIEVAPDADPAHGLTRRLRQLAQEDAAQEVVEPVPWWRRWPPRRSDVHVGGVESERRGGAHRADPGGRPSRSHPLAVLAVFVLATTVGAVVFLAVLTPLRSVLPGASSTEVAGTVVTAQVLDDVVAVSAAPTIEVVDDARQTPAPQRREVGQPADAVPTADVELAEIHADVQKVLDARAWAWQETDPDLLDDAVASGSPAMTVETNELERALDAEVRYPRVIFDVEKVELLERADDRLRVRATVIRAALEARDDEGWLLRAPEQVDEVELELVRQDGRWLLWSWTDEAR